MTARCWGGGGDCHCEGEYQGVSVEREQFCILATRTGTWISMCDKVTQGLTPLSPVPMSLF